jgi:integrase
MEDVKVGGAKKSGTIAGQTQGQKLRREKIQASNQHAYTLEEVAEMLDKLPEPARTVCAVAAFTGFTRSELRGLKWSDYDGTEISIQRKIDDKEIQSILRHADVSTTMAYYILPNRERAEAGLKKLGRVARQKYGIRG